MARHCDPLEPPVRPDGEILVALAGNPNVGKSTLFNALTGLGVSTAHYPGTTREVSTGTARWGSHSFGVVDLPGTYALGRTAEDERVARRALEDLAPDVLVVVVDPSSLSRNLSLVLEALDTGLPVVIAVNLVDEARRAGVEVDTDVLADALGVAVIPTIATQGVGVEALVEAAYAATRSHDVPGARYSLDFEALLEPLVRACETGHSDAPERGCRSRALALLEGRSPEAETQAVPPALVRSVAAVRTAMRGHFGEDAGMHLVRERHGLAGVLAERSIRRVEPAAGRIPHSLWALTTSPWTGVPLVVLTAAAIFGFLFFAGEALAAAFSTVWEAWASPGIAALVSGIAGDGMVARILLWGFDAGIEASLAIGIPYILTFYFLLGLLEDTGYLNSLAFLTDRLMHRFGMHGRAIVPLVAAAGCNVPALVAAGQLTTERERRIASTLVLFVPCSARTAVVLGAVGHYVGWQPTLIVLGVVALIWVGVALTLERLLPGDSRGLVMEMFGFRRPSLRRVAAKAWEQFREFLFVATPIVVAGSLVLGGLYESGWLVGLARPLSPVIEGWLGLPAIAGVTLIAGMLRKELSLQLLIALAVATAGAASVGLAAIMSPTDLVVYALVNAIALPCISSVAVYWRRQGAAAALGVTALSVGIALLAGGVVARVLGAFGFGM